MYSLWLQIAEIDLNYKLQLFVLTCCLLDYLLLFLSERNPKTSWNIRYSSTEDIQEIISFDKNLYKAF